MIEVPKSGCCNINIRISPKYKNNGYLDFLWIKKLAINNTTITFANSDGWKSIGPKSNQRLTPAFGVVLSNAANKITIIIKKESVYFLKFSIEI